MDVREPRDEGEVRAAWGVLSRSFGWPLNDDDRFVDGACLQGALRPGAAPAGCSIRQPVGARPDRHALAFVAATMARAIARMSSSVVMYGGMT